jgi:hypothetical protein
MGFLKITALAATLAGGSLALAASPASAAPVSGASGLAGSAPIAEQAQWGYYGGGYRRHWGGPGWRGRGWGGPRMVCRVRYTPWGPRQVCFRRW